MLDLSSLSPAHSNIAGSVYAMQALPLFLDRLADPITAVIVSVTVVLIFGAWPFWLPLLATAASQPCRWSCVKTLHSVLWSPFLCLSTKQEPHNCFEHPAPNAQASVANQHLCSASHKVAHTIQACEEDAAEASSQASTVCAVCVACAKKPGANTQLHIVPPAEITMTPATSFECNASLFYMVASLLYMAASWLYR